MPQLWEITIRHNPYSLEVRLTENNNVTKHIVVTGIGEYISLKEIRAQIGFARLVDAKIMFPYLENMVDPQDNSPGQSMYPYIMDIKMIEGKL